MNAEPVARRRRRVLVPAVAGVVLALSLTGCAAGRQAQTVDQRPSQQGANADVGAIALRGVAIEPPSGNSYPKGSNVRLAVVLVNNGSAPDRLTGITTSAAGGWSAYPTTAAADQVAGAAAGGSTPGGTQSVPIPPGGRTSFGVPDATGGLVLLGTKGTIYPGTIVSMNFTFARAGTVTVPVPVRLADDTSPPTLEPLPTQTNGA